MPIPTRRSFMRCVTILSSTTSVACGLAQYGARTVRVDGQPVRSCITRVSVIGHAKLVTLRPRHARESIPFPEGLKEQVPQCSG